MARCDRFFYWPTRTDYASPRDYDLAHCDVTFPSRDGTMLHGWFFPASAGGEARGTVVHCHGNAGNISGHFEFVRWLPACGWNVLCFDYRGYGRSAGRPSREGTVLDAHGAIDHAKTLPGVDPRRLVVFGQSIGGAIAIVAVAERDDVAGLAVDGPFSNYRRIAAWHIRRNPLLFVLAWWVVWLIPRTLDAIDYVARLAPTPLFVFTGDQDRIVDPRMSQALYEAAGEPKALWILPGLDHTEALEVCAEEARPRLLAFFDRCAARGAYSL